MIVAYTTWGYPPKRARETRKKAREGQIFTKHAVLIIFIQKILQSADSRAISGPPAPRLLLLPSKTGKNRQNRKISPQSLL